MIFLRRESRTEIPKWGWYMIITEISHRTPALLEQLLEIWERSVRATHTFLSEAEILRIREYVPCALSQTPCRPVAFMGLDRENLEMLFVAPEARGQGIGGQLVRWGIETYSLSLVAVNEQNPQAVGFYRYMGFQVYRRTACDEQGGPNPLLYLRRPETGTV